MFRFIKFPFVLLIFVVVTTVSPLPSSSPANGIEIENGVERLALGEGGLQTIWDLWRKKHRRGGTRGEFCSIVPNGRSRVTWNRQPTFVWQGTVKEIRVYQIGKNKPIFQEKPALGQQSMRGPTLQPGHRYDYWVQYEVMDEGKPIIDEKLIPLVDKVLPENEYRQIEVGLATLERESASMSADDRAFKRARYFDEENLFLDFMHELVTVPNPSWKQELDSLRSTICQ